MTDIGIRAATLADLPALGAADETVIEGSDATSSPFSLLQKPGAGAGWGTAPMQALLNREHWLVSGILDGLDDGDPEIVYYRRTLL